MSPQCVLHCILYTVYCIISVTTVLTCGHDVRGTRRGQSVQRVHTIHCTHFYAHYTLHTAHTSMLITHCIMYTLYTLYRKVRATVLTCGHDARRTSGSNYFLLGFLLGSASMTEMTEMTEMCKSLIFNPPILPFSHPNSSDIYDCSSDYSDK